MDKTKVEELSKLHPKPDFHFTYGTAGFRTKADRLDSVMFRMGLLAVLRSKAKQGKNIGVMITASHNPIEDNGVKLVDPLGEMLEQSWEVHATQIAQAEDSSLYACIEEIIKSENIDFNIDATVVVGKDTRPSCEELVKSLKDGIEAMNGKCKDFGLLTTPQLHYIVCCLNTNGEYGEPSEEGYYMKFTQAFKNLYKLLECTKPSSIVIDGGNGVGGIKAKHLKEQLKGYLDLQICNDGSSGGVLNQGCGADFVKTKQKPPNGIDFQENQRYLSFDGDADRVVYYYKNKQGNFQLLDGDKIATLLASFIKEKLDDIGITLEKGMGVVQTAYANGSSTEYLTSKMKVPVVIAKTGVKHLHHKALNYDIGVYFEANGHGTIIYSKECEEKIRSYPTENLSDDQKKNLKVMQEFINLTNQMLSLLIPSFPETSGTFNVTDVPRTIVKKYKGAMIPFANTVGDAISDMLLVETVINAYQLSCESWNDAYTDLPNKLNKVSVKDRNALKTNDNETRLLHPIELQNKIDDVVKNWSRARAFVRPSGTEDVVRVYAESETVAITENILLTVSQYVYDICEGVGERPVVPPLVEQKS